MPPFVDDVVISPELALVDPDLAALAREALPDRALLRLVAVGVHEVAPAQSAPAGWRDRVTTTPVLTLLATAAVSLVVTAFTGHESADGARPLVFDVVQEADTSAEVAGDWQIVDEVEAPVVRQPTAVAPTRDATTTLVWPGSPQATYDVELVRGNAVIYSSRSTSSHVVLPPKWQWNGSPYTVQPQDQAFVWRVVDERRASTPIVNGVLALDMTPISRFSELG